LKAYEKKRLLSCFLCSESFDKNVTQTAVVAFAAMASHKVLVLPGDGIGPEIIEEAVKVLRVVEKATKTEFDLSFELLGGCSIDKHGVALTTEVLAKAKASDAVLFGSVGGPKWYILPRLLFFTPQT
jgi:isocitrate dehydrogenase